MPCVHGYIRSSALGIAQVGQYKEHSGGLVIGVSETSPTIKAPGTVPTIVASGIGPTLAVSVLLAGTDGVLAKLLAGPLVGGGSVSESFRVPPAELVAVALPENSSWSLLSCAGEPS